MRILLTILFSFSFTWVCAQYDPQQYWYLGKVILANGEELEGTIKYDLDANSILLNTTEDGMETFHANQFIGFTILMDREGIVRTFYSIPYPTETGYKRPLIFEVLHEGPHSLLAREFVEAPKSLRIKSGESIRTKYLQFNYFLLDNTGEVFPLGKKKNQILDALSNHESELKAFIKQEKLKLSKAGDLAKLIAYYDELQSIN